MMDRFPSTAGRVSGLPTVAILFSMTLLASSALAGPFDSKLDGRIASRNPDETLRFLVLLTHQANLSMLSGATRSEAVYSALRLTAKTTQGPILRLLEADGASYQPFFVANLISVTGPAELATRLALRDDVAHVYLDETSRLRAPSVNQKTTATRWNLDLIGAPTMWARGFRAQGVGIG